MHRARQIPPIAAFLIGIAEPWFAPTEWFLYVVLSAAIVAMVTGTVVMSQAEKRPPNKAGLIFLHYYYRKRKFHNSIIAPSYMLLCFQSAATLIAGLTIGVFAIAQFQ